MQTQKDLIALLLRAANLNVSVDPAFIAAASKQTYSEDLEGMLLPTKLRKALSNYIVSDRNVLFLYASVD